MNNNLRNYWYIVAQSQDLKHNQIISRQILDEWLVVFRGIDGKPCVMKDKCLHRCARLSKGTVANGLLTCPYHGWVYNGKGQVESIPSQACKITDETRSKSLAFPCIEQEGYIYVCLNLDNQFYLPYAMPKYGQLSYKKIRLVNEFNNTLANCVENFIDIPHTAYVHRGIFRKIPHEKIKARLTRHQGHLQIDYVNEKSNLGSFSYLLNPQQREIFHQDNYFAPNITHVIYRLPGKWEYLITSQTVPVSQDKSIVYTEICFDFGFWNKVALTKWIVKRQARRVIDQDINILNDQMQVIKKYGQHFCQTSADLVHTFTSEIIEALINNQDLTSLPSKDQEIEFWV